MDWNKRIAEAIDKYGFAGVHDAANLFPMMSDDQYKSLVESVSARGFREPIVVTEDNLVLDGRNRLCASIEISLDVPIRRFTPSDPIAYVVDLNRNRRHLSVGQWSAVGLEAEKMYAKQARERQGTRTDLKKNNIVVDLPQSSKGKARDMAAKAVGVSGSSISKAKKIFKEDPETFEKLKNGNISLNEAEKTVKEKYKQVVKRTFNKTTDMIDWTTYTWNPITGCKYGCEYCYAADMAKRYKMSFEPTLNKDRLNMPKDTPLPPQDKREVFVGSFADMFGPWVPSEWIEAVLETIRDNPQWIYQFLTKNPHRYAEFDFPENCWLGATVDTQRRADNATDAFDEMLEAQKNNNNLLFISCEPLLEEISVSGMWFLDWIIVGGRSRSDKLPEFQPKSSWVGRILKDINLINSDPRRYDDQPEVKVWFKTNLRIKEKL